MKKTKAWIGTNGKSGINPSHVFGVIVFEKRKAFQQSHREQA